MYKYFCCALLVDGRCSDRLHLGVKLLISGMYYNDQNKKSTFCFMALCPCFKQYR